jgi:hypothetical protein
MSVKHNYPLELPVSSFRDMVALDIAALQAMKAIQSLPSIMVKLESEEPYFGLANTAR